ncbi:MAG: hypothetical protein Q4D56_05860 [Bacteroides sp.]|nr:hypothetical protein [Bacteroides sp.]
MKGPDTEQVRSRCGPGTEQVLRCHDMGVWQRGNMATVVSWGCGWVDWLMELQDLL